MMSRTTARAGASPPVQDLQSGRTMQRSMVWMGALLLAPLHMQQCRYATLVVSLPDSLISQLHFNLTDATHWMTHYNGFSYEEFYEFIVDFFEADATPEAQEASAKLLEWWNKYVSGFAPAAVTTNIESSPGQYSPGLQPHAQRHLVQQGETRSQPCDNSVRLAAVRLTRPRSFCSTSSVHLFRAISSPFTNARYPTREPRRPATARYRAYKVLPSLQSCTIRSNIHKCVHRDIIPPKSSSRVYNLVRITQVVGRYVSL